MCNVYSCIFVPYLNRHFVSNHDHFIPYTIRDGIYNHADICLWTWYELVCHISLVHTCLAASYIIVLYYLCCKTVNVLGTHLLVHTGIYMVWEDIIPGMSWYQYLYGTSNEMILSQVRVGTGIYMVWDDIIIPSTSWYRY